MRTTLDLPESLVSEAMKVSNSKTKTSVIIQALQELVQKSKIAPIKNYKGKLNLSINLDELRNRK